LIRKLDRCLHVDDIRVLMSRVRQELTVSCDERGKRLDHWVN
jgi:hypothetical protein